MLSTEFAGTEARIAAAFDAEVRAWHVKDDALRTEETVKLQQLEQALLDADKVIAVTRTAVVMTLTCFYSTASIPCV